MIHLKAILAPEDINYNRLTDHRLWILCDEVRETPEGLEIHRGSRVKKFKVSEYKIEEVTN